MNKYNFEIVGLGAMERKMFLHMADNGFAVEAEDGQDTRATTHADKIPTNSMEVQRDYFGAHTYECVYQVGVIS